MRKNSEEKPIDIISMEEYLKKRQVVRQPETVWEGWREKSASALKLADHGHSRKGGRTEQIRKERQVQEWWLQPNLSKDLKRAVNRSVKR